MLINCHTHTLRSHDSAASPLAVCECAINSELAGVTFTDHCDCEFHGQTDVMGQFQLAQLDFYDAKKTYGNILDLYFGIELGDPLFAPAFADQILSSFDFDAVLLSVHAVRFTGYDEPFSRIDFSCADDGFIAAYLDQYFTDVLDSVCRFDFDILCHLTVPLRYIMLKYGKTVDINPFKHKIDLILKEVISRGKTLEINTSALYLPGGFLMPDEEIINKYLDLGGRSFCLGSDAHSPALVSSGLNDAAALLKRKKVKSLCCYKNRQRLDYAF